MVFSASNLLDQQCIHNYFTTKLSEGFISKFNGMETGSRVDASRCLESLKTTGIKESALFSALRPANGEM